MATRMKPAEEPAFELAWESTLAWRMRRHHLVERAPRRSLVAVVDRLGGLHAQLMSSAELTAWARVDELSSDAIRDALWKSRSLVKLWAMRGTLHMLPARNLGLWLGGLGTYEHYLKPVWLRNFRITRTELEALISAVGRALDGHLLTREQLGTEVARVMRSKDVKEKVQGSWGAYLKPASFRGKLCFAPNDGQRVRFTSPGSWMRGELEQLDGEEALREITRRYVGAFGPATREDLARWWGVQPAQGGRMLDALRGEIVPVDVEGSAGWMLEKHAREVAAAQPAQVARLLPGFDMWTIGASRGSAPLLNPAYRRRVYRDQGWISPVLLVNGRMEGVWRHERKGKQLLVTVESFERQQPKWVRDQVDAEAQRLDAFLGGGLSLNWTR
jgi:Winged helix DNA-binding domain